MSGNLNKWTLWVVLAAIVIAALVFVDFGNLFSPEQTATDQIEAVATDEELDQIDDDTQFEQTLEEAGPDEPID